MSESKTTLFEGKHLRMVRTGHWEFVERIKASGAAIIIAKTDEDKLLLVEQFRPPLDKKVIEFPAGLVGDTHGNEKEPMIQAAKRELLEETGYEARNCVLLHSGPASAGLSSEENAIFYASGLRKVGNGGGVDGEEIVLHEVPLRNVKNWLDEKVKSGFAVDLKVFACLWLMKANSGL